MLTTVFEIESMQPFVVITFSFTICDVANPRKVCVTFGGFGKRIGTGAEPSPKSQTH